MRLLSFGLAAGSLAASALLMTPAPARACGGCFLPPAETPTVVTGHQMAVAINPTRTILWDQFRYDGDAADFSWVLPVKGNARLELSNDAWFDTLSATTAPQITAPFVSCGGGGGFGCGCASADGAALNESSRGGGGGVQVIHRDTVGPYETVTLRSTNPQALNAWLAANNYTVPADLEPVIAAYVQEQFDFIALKLAPGEGINAMKPVRVVTEGAGFSFPLRMVAAGTGSEVAITLYVLAEGRWELQNATNVSINMADLEWDFGAGRSNYTDLRNAALQQNGGNAWLTSYAKRGALLSAQQGDPIFGTVTYQVGGTSTGASSSSSGGTGQTFFASTIAEAYVYQGIVNGEATTQDCLSTLQAIQNSDREVVDPCDAEGNNCRALAADEIDARTLKCGPLDDVAAALVGTHPASVWVTRLEANLPRSALSQDFVMAGSQAQTRVENVVQAEKHKGDPCSGTGNAAGGIIAARGDREMGPLASTLVPFVLGMTWLRSRTRRSRQQQAG